MSNKGLVSSFTIGFIVGTAIGTAIGLIYAPESGEDARKMWREKTEAVINPFKKAMFNLKWMMMSPRERYTYLWDHGGSLHEWRRQYKMLDEHGQTA